jgi:hypothetical protein
MHYLVKKKHGESQDARIVSAILDDVTDRRGWRQAWDSFDDDVREEIIARWIELVQTELLKP